MGDRGDVALFRCTACTFVSGVPALNEPALIRYQGYHSGEAPPDPEVRYAEWLAEAEARVGRGRLLEVGAGLGGFVRAALCRGWSVDATEVSQVGLAALRGTAARVHEGDLTTADYPDQAFDLAVSLEVLEHLPDPMAHLRALFRLSRAGGLLLLTTPNFGGLSRRWLGLRWRGIATEHLGYFDPPTLRRALRGAAYSRVTVRSRSLDVSAWRRKREEPVPIFDPHAAAKLRDAIEARWALRAAKQAANALLGFTGVGDSLLVWAQR